MAKIRVKKKRKILWKSVVFFFVYMIFFMGVSSFLITLYGPFKNVKRTFVGSAMETMNHQYLATAFLSQKQIDKILDKKDVTKVSDEQNLSEIKINKKADNTIVKQEIHEKRFDGYILEIADPRRVKVGYTRKMKVRGQTTSEIVEEFGGIAGINGAGFTDESTSGKSFVGTGAFPEGIVVSEGKIISSNVREDEKVEAIAFDKSGNLVVGKHTLNELMSMGIQEALSFNNTLIINGKAQVKYGENGLAPRTAIAQKADGHVLLLVIDGRKFPKEGATIKEVQDLLISQGAVNAANLDGGSSTTMYYDGDIVNDPSDSSGERTISTAFYVTP